MTRRLVRWPTGNLMLPVAVSLLAALVAFWVVYGGFFAARIPLLLLLVAWLVAIVLPGQPAWLRVVLAIAGWPLLFYLKQNQDPLQWAEVIQNLLVLYLLLASATHPGARERLLALRWPCGLLAAFVGWSFLMALTHTPDIQLGLGEALKSTRFIPLTFVLVMVDLRESHARRYILPLLVLTAGGVALYGLYDVVNRLGLDPASLIRTSGTVIRLKVIFDNPNNLGALMATVLVFVGGYLVNVRARRVLLAWTLPLLAAMLWVILLTSSRRSWLLVPLSFAVVIPFMRYRGRRIALVAMGVLAVLVALMFYGELIYPRMTALLTFSDINLRHTRGGLQLRLVQYERILAELDTLSRVVIGVGSGTVGAAQQAAGGPTLPAVDSYYFRVLGGYGLVGLVLYLSGSLAAFWGLLRTAASQRLGEGDHALVVAALAGMALILLTGIGANINITFPASMYLWLFAGLGLSASLRLPAGTGEVSSP